MKALLVSIFLWANGLAIPSNSAGLNNLVKKGRFNEHPLSKELESRPGQFPFVVSFQKFISNNRPWDHRCQGTLINRTHVITTALCATWLRHKGYFYGEALVGGWNKTNEKEFLGERKWVKNIEVYPGWHGKPIYHTYPKDLKNNIALVRFNIPVKFNKNVQPLRLAQANMDFLGKSCTTIGWNWKAFIPGEKKHALIDPINFDTLHKIQMNIVNNDVCIKAINAVSIDEDSMICAVTTNSKSGKTSLCPFEEGAALICEGDDNLGPYLAGLASFGNADGCEYNSVTYTRISHFLQFINTT